MNDKTLLRLRVNRELFKNYVLVVWQERKALAAEKLERKLEEFMEEEIQAIYKKLKEEKDV